MISPFYNILLPLAYEIYQDNLLVGYFVTQRHMCIMKNIYGILAVLLLFLFNFVCTRITFKDSAFARDCIMDVLQQVKLFKSVPVVIINADTLLGEKMVRTEGYTFQSRDFMNKMNGPLVNEVYVIMVESAQDLEKGINFVRISSSWNPSAKFIVHVKESIALKEISNVIFKNYIFNITVIAKTPTSNKYSLFAFNPELDSCHKPAKRVLEFISACSNYTGQSTFLYKTKYKKLKNCHFKMVTHEIYPFTNLNKTIPGIEEEILLTWQNKDNVTAELVKYEINENFGVLLDNGTYTGMLGRVNEEIEGAIGGFALKLERIYGFDFSFPSFIDHHKVVINKAKRLNVWKYVSRSISSITYLIFLLYVVLCFIVTIASVIGKKDVAQNILIVTGYFTGNIKKYGLQNKLSYKIIIFCMLVYHFVMNSMFQGFLSSAITQPSYEHQVDDLQEVIQNYKGEVNLPGLLEYKHDLGCATKLECLIAVKNSKEPAFTIVSEMLYQYHKWLLSSEADESFYVLREPVVTTIRTTFFIRGSPLRDALSDHSRRIQTAGLLKTVAEKLMFSSKLKSIYHYNSNSSNTNKYQMVNDFFEPFMLLAIGKIISCVVFLCEILFSKRKICNNVNCDQRFHKLHCVFSRHV